MISVPKRNSMRTVLSELSNVHTGVNSHYHRLEIQSPNTILQRQENEATAKNHAFELEQSYGMILLHLRREEIQRMPKKM